MPFHDRRDRRESGSGCPSRAPGSHEVALTALNDAGSDTERVIARFVVLRLVSRGGPKAAPADARTARSYLGLLHRSDPERKLLETLLAEGARTLRGGAALLALALGCRARGDEGGAVAFGTESWRRGLAAGRHDEAAQAAGLLAGMRGLDAVERRAWRWRADIVRRREAARAATS